MEPQHRAGTLMKDVVDKGAQDRSSPRQPGKERGGGGNLSWKPGEDGGSHLEQMLLRSGTVGQRYGVVGTPHGRGGEGMCRACAG